MQREWARRKFLQGGLALTVGYFAGPQRSRAAISPNERLNIAAVGSSNRAAADIQAVSGENLVAIADIDAKLLERGAARYPAARRYADFRQMLETEAEHIDAVVVGCPDHTHAPAAAMALRMGKHVYCEKPLTHTVREARTLAELARQHQCVTQLGTQIHAGENYRRVVEWVRSGTIGAIREVHVWAAARYSGAKFTTGSPAPPHVNWDLWLGPATKRPYSEHVHPRNWRGFWDYGTGALGDFGCHYMDLPHWALDLRHPTRISAQGPPVNPVSTPEWLVVQYDYPARGPRPAVRLTWYDSGRQPELLKTLRRRDGSPLNFKSGHLFVGEQGMIISDYTRHLLLPEDKFAGVSAPPKSIPKSLGHHAEWLQAIRSNGTTTCNFDYSGALTEAVLLGTVAYRSGCVLEWSPQEMRITNAAQAQALLHKEYRQGWTL